MNADDLASGAESAYENVATGIAINTQGLSSSSTAGHEKCDTKAVSRVPRPWVS